MKDRFLNIVETAIVRHLGQQQLTIQETQRLDQDLGLDPLDIIMIVIRLEDQIGIEFPIGSLDRIRTVAELADAIRAWQPEFAIGLAG